VVAVEEGSGLHGGGGGGGGSGAEFGAPGRSAAGSSYKADLNERRKADAGAL
jgi:hypothetical protein